MYINLLIPQKLVAQKSDETQQQQTKKLNPSWCLRENNKSLTALFSDERHF